MVHDLQNGSIRTDSDEFRIVNRSWNRVDSSCSTSVHDLTSTHSISNPRRRCHTDLGSFLRLVSAYMCVCVISDRGV